MTVADVAPALLEDWLRHRYFDAAVDISSSGVQDYGLGELRELVGLSTADLDAVVFRDSPSTGCEPLRAAIAERYGYPSADGVVVTHGSTEALFLALAAVVRPGDEVIALSPAYQSLTSIAEALGARLVPWHLAAQDDFIPDLDRLRDLLSERTRLVVVNFPHNPTGTTLSAAAFEEFLALLDGHPAILLWDGAFTELAYDAAPLPEPATLRERVISTGTLSKAYGLPGLRVGWCAVPPDVRAEMIRVRDYVSISTSPLTEALAVAVLRHADAVLGPRLWQATQNRALLRAWAHRTAGISLPLPMGGVSAFPAVSGVEDTTALCERLQDDGVLTVPGGCFGVPDRIRIGFGGPPAELATGLAALGALLGTPDRDIDGSMA